MGDIADAKIFGLTIRESATDGSDFTNPAADYRRLFLGEDGLLHLRDSSGTITDIGGSAGSVATDALWDAAGDLAVGSGANTAAKLTMGAAGGALSRVNGAVAWNSGTSFPTGATGDRYWRTDLGMEFYYDGTRWRCTCPHQLTIDARNDGSIYSVSASATNNRAPVPWRTGMTDIWLEEFVFASQVSTTNNGTSNWTITLVKYTAAVSATTIATGSTSADTADQFATHTVSIAALLGSTHTFFQMPATKVSSPGPLAWAEGILAYRYVTT